MDRCLDGHTYLPSPPPALPVSLTAPQVRLGAPPAKESALQVPGQAGPRGAGEGEGAGEGAQGQGAEEGEEEQQAPGDLRQGAQGHRHPHAAF